MTFPHLLQTFHRLAIISVASPDGKEWSLQPSRHVTISSMANGHPRHVMSSSNLRTRKISASEMTIGLGNKPLGVTSRATCHRRRGSPLGDKLIPFHLRNPRATVNYKVQSRRWPPVLPGPVSKPRCAGFKVPARGSGAAHGWVAVAQDPPTFEGSPLGRNSPDNACCSALSPAEATCPWPRKCHCDAKWSRSYARLTAHSSRCAAWLCSQQH